jgi:hypothetical protein
MHNHMVGLRQLMMDEIFGKKLHIKDEKVGG